MITVVSDTHGTDGHRLDGRTLTAVREAELVIHAGDFTTEAVLDAFEAEAGSAGSETEADDDGADGEFVGVYGNNDDAAVRDRLAGQRVIEHGGVRFVVVHGHEHGDTARPLLGRQERADVVVVGHSHQPGHRDLGAVTVLNPGSHADPRWYRPAHAELEPTETGLTGRLVAPDGEVFDEFEVTAGGAK
ncbi:MAG: metallophosphoesterase [Halosimplex sp.]